MKKNIFCLFAHFLLSSLLFCVHRTNTYYHMRTHTHDIIYGLDFLDDNQSVIKSSHESDLYPPPHLLYLSLFLFLLFFSLPSLK